jgi:hypothetical protein
MAGNRGDGFIVDLLTTMQGNANRREAARFIFLGTVEYLTEIS